MKQFRKVSDGETITITSPGSYEKGDFVYINGLYGIAENTVDTGETLILLIERNIVINLDVIPSENFPVNVGVLIFYDIKNDIVTTQRENEHLLVGRIIEANGNNVDIFVFSDNINSIKKLMIYNIYFNTETEGIHNINSMGNFKDTFTISNTDKIAVDKNNNIYYYNFKTIYKLDKNGELIWEYSGHSDGSTSLREMRIINNQVFSISGDYFIILDFNGNEIYKYSSNYMYDFTIDNDNNYYLLNASDIKKIDTNNNVTQFYSSGADYGKIRYINNKIVFVDPNQDIFLLDMSGTLLDSIYSPDYKFTSKDMLILNNHIYIALGTSGIRKYDENLNLVWEFSDLAFHTNIIADPDSNIYCTGWNNSDTVKIYKMREDGSSIWEYIYTGSEVQDLTLNPVKEVE